MENRKAVEDAKTGIAGYEKGIAEANRSTQWRIRRAEAEREKSLKPYQDFLKEEAKKQTKREEAKTLDRLREQNPLEYMNKLYTEGLISDDCFTASQEQINAKIQTNKVFMMGVLPYNLLYEDEQWIDKFEMLPFLTSETSSEMIWPGNLRHTRAWGNFVMTDKCKYPV